MAYNSTSWSIQGNTKAGATSSTTDALTTGALTVSGAGQFSNTLTVGVDDTGYDVKFFGATTGQYMLWDESADELVLAGDSKLSFHDAAGGENIIATSNGHLEINAGTTLDITAPTVDINAATELNIDGKEVFATDYGVGPVDASLNAIQKITGQITDKVRLKEYRLDSNR